MNQDLTMIRSQLLWSSASKLVWNYQNILHDKGLNLSECWERKLLTEKVRWGVTKIMWKYTVKACGYCSEVHVGPWGHNAKLYGEFKHQWRDGKHGWQDAMVDEVFTPNYVWHVRDPNGPPLKSSLKRFYGKAPVVAGIYAQAGDPIPRKYRPMMRLDIVVPDNDEARLVA